MNCERFQAVAGDLARNEDRDPRPGSPAGVLVIESDDRDAALAHIGDCERCAQTLTDQNDLSEWLGSLTDQMNSLQAPAHLEAQLLAAHRSRTRVRSIRSSLPRRRYWVTAAAAVLLVVLGLLAWRWQIASVRQPAAQAISNSVTAQPSHPQKPQPSLIVPVAGIESATQRSNPPATQPSSGASTQQEAQRSTQASNSAARKASRSGRHFASSQLAKRGKAKRAIAEQAAGLAANVQPTEVATDFVPVGYGSAMDLQDGGQLVRVELLRSALATFGLPMNMDRVDERVKADVLVGADGLARAIRFVK